MMETEEASNFIPRDYQSCIVEKALKENIIVFLPTGAGKTYIATLLIKQLCGSIKKLFTEGGKRSFFLVNTVQLIEQQAHAIRQCCPLSVGEYSGDKGVDLWEIKKWHKELDEHNILVMTAQIFHDMLHFNFIKLEQTNLIIFDECHRAVQGHPMRQIMTRFESCPPEKQPRVLGLTATLLNGSCKVDEVDDEITHLEQTFHSKIVSFIDNEQVLRFSTNPNEKVVYFEDTILDELGKFCEQRLNDLLEKIKNIQFELFAMDVEIPQNYTILNAKDEKPRKVFKNIFMDLIYSLNDMGIYGLYVGCLAQIIRLERMKLSISDGFLYSIANVCLTELIFLRKLMSDKVDFSSFENVTKHCSSKMNKTFELLKNFNEDSCIIFVQRRFTAKILYFMIDNLKKEKGCFKNVLIDFVIGNTNTNVLATCEGLYSRKINSEVIERFYKKKINVLIATDVLEEGTDIPFCNVVVKYDVPVTFRSYIQSKGRARTATSTFILLVSKSEEGKFQNRHGVFKCIEKKLKDILIRDRAQPSEEEIDDSLYKDEEIPSYYPTGPNGPKITAIAAPSVINRYVLSLPQDKFCKMNPIYFVNKTEDMEDTQFRVQLQLPSNCPLKKPIVGHPMPNTKSAKQSAALEACKLLYEMKELTEFALPRGSKSDYLEDPQWFPNWIPEEVKPDGPELGTSKKIRTHEKKYASILAHCQPVCNEDVYLHVFDLKPRFELADYEGQRRKFYFSLLKDCSTFGILTNQPLPQICDFPLFISMGEMEVKMKMNIKLEPLDANHLKKLHKFHCLVFMQVLAVVKSFMVSNPSDSKTASYLICPVLPGTTSLYEIDWSVVNNYQQKFSQLDEVSDKVRKGMSFDYNDLEGSLIVPWYRGYNISKQTYIVTRIAEELTPLSKFPSAEFKTYADYFKAKYSKIIYHLNQHLVDVYPVSSKLNCIVPRLRTSKRKKLDGDDREAMEESLVPELCAKLDFPTKFWVKFLFIPSALYRLNRLLVAEELRAQLAQDLQFKELSIPPENLLPLLVHAKDCAKHSQIDTTPTAPSVNTIANSLEQSVSEWKSAKETNNYPWSNQELPVSLDRVMDSISIIDVKNYVNFFTRNNVDMNMSKDTSENGSSNDTSPEVCTKKEKKKKFEEPPWLSIVEITASLAGPQQSEVLEAITSLSAHDIVNYERLETLGDSFLKYAVSLSLFLFCERIDEGKLTHLKGKLIGNRNLFYSANQLKLQSLVEVYNFAPADDWIPPRFGVEPTLREFMVDLKLPPEELFTVFISEEEQISGKLLDTTADMIDEKLINLASSLVENDETNPSRSSTSISYLNQQEVSDKCVADSVEALIGVYLKDCGIEEAFKLLLRFGILPEAIIKKEFVFDPDFYPAVSYCEMIDTDEQVKFLLEESCYEILEERIGYTFNDKKYILQALSHTSFTQNNITECYQRLEFLGDALLDFLITCYIFETCDNLSPGQVTDVRSALVNNVTFACLAVRYGMHKSLLYRSVELKNILEKFATFQESKNHVIGEEVLILLAEEDCCLAESVDVPKVLGDLFESIAGAIYLDSGKSLKTVWRVYYNLMKVELKEFCSNVPKNIVRRLYELNIDARFLSNERLSDCENMIMVPLEVRINNELRTVFGFGPNKSCAKRAAAKLAINLLTNES